jgi:hypothetical protein
MKEIEVLYLFIIFSPQNPTCAMTFKSYPEKPLHHGIFFNYPHSNIRSLGENIGDKWSLP